MNDIKRLCTRCGGRIPQKRIDAVPDCVKCLVCQGRCDLSPAEQFGSRLSAVMAVGGETDGGQFRVGGDCYAG